jgi:hypothetical protein
MATNLSRYEDDLTALTQLRNELIFDIAMRLTTKKPKTGSAETTGKKFEEHYQHWYTEALAVVRQLAPDRLVEFQELYNGDPKRKGIYPHTFSIRDWMSGGRPANFDGLNAVANRFQAQSAILSSLERRFKSTLFDIKRMLQADLFDSEIDAARELSNHGFLRGAGAMAGVILERHLVEVATTHQVKIVKKNPTMNDLNQPLKDAGVIDVPVWRNIQRLADIRNLCDHNKEREPTPDEVSELIEGVDKLTKTLF